MHVIILDNEFKKEKRFQIMRRAAHGVDHVYPGKLFTLAQAREMCAANGFIIDVVGTFYQVLK